MATEADLAWIANANTAIQLSLVQPGESEPSRLHEFNPDISYQIFGKEEAVFGYKDLKINMRFAAHNLYPNVDMHFSDKFKTVGDTAATDVLGILEEFVPEHAMASSSSFDKKIQEEDASSFTPPGTLLESYSKNGRDYEIWTGTLDDPKLNQLLGNIQVLVNLFIEGGVQLPLDDQEWTLKRWRVYLLYEKLGRPPTSKGSVYSFCGYATSYRFSTYTFTDLDPKDEFVLPIKDELDLSRLPHRGRISQFLVLPPHQRQSHGGRLYEAVYKYLKNDKTCIEITVEDPNEDFDRLRDYNDYARLVKSGALAKLPLAKEIDAAYFQHRSRARVPTARLLDKAQLECTRRAEKMVARQFARMWEVHALARIPRAHRQPGTARLTRRAKTANDDDRAYYYWRTLVKQRVFRQNRDLLLQVESPAERVEYLERTVDGVLEEYEGLLEAMEKGRPEPDDGQRRIRNRKRIVDDEDEEEEIVVGRTKKTKTG